MVATSKKRRRRTPKRKSKVRKRQQHGGRLDLQKMLGKTGIGFHWLVYQYMGPGTHLKKRPKRGDPGINTLDRIAKQHDIDYSHVHNLKDKHTADRKMIKAIDKLPGKKTLTEKVVKNIMKIKVNLKI